LRHLLDTELDGQSINRQLRRLRDMEQEAQGNNRSLNDVLEQIGLERLSEETGEAFNETDLARSEHIQRADAHLQALRRQLQFLQELADAGNDVATAIVALEARINTAVEARADIVLRQQELPGLNNHFTYEPGTEVVGILRGHFGDTNVTGPDSNGIIVVTDGARQLTFLPSRTGAAGGELHQSILARAGTRQLQEGVIAVEPRQLRGIEAQVMGQGGSWNEVIAGITVAQSTGGETLILISEGSLRIAEAAIRAETQLPGSGLDLIRSQLRSEAARRGLRHQLETEWNSETDARKLELLRDMETAGTSLNAALEAVGQPLLIAEARAELVQYLQDNGFFNDPWVRARINDGNWREIQGVLGERLAEMEISRNLARLSTETGRTLRLVSEVRVVRRLPYNTKAEWIAANEPQRSDFASDAEFQAALEHFRDMSNSVRELTAEGSVWQEVNEIDHMSLEQIAPGELRILRIYEVKSGSTSGAQAQVAAKRSSVTQVLETGNVTDSAGETSEGRIYLYENNNLDTNLTPELRLPAEGIETEVRTPSSGGSPLGPGEIRQLSRDIVTNPANFGVSP
jgi:hypothetical protein